MNDKFKKAVGIIVGFGFWIGVFGCVYYFRNSNRNDNHGSDSKEYNAEENDSENSNDCKFEDGMHSATVDYFNPDTGHSATYSLDVEVEDCEVTVIYFPSGGWLDDSHISPAEIDEGGDAELQDEQGRTFSVHIDD